ncbi:MAG: hypothetical protein L3J07_02255 [Candidatus Magasanikbacteria bacterium]|nr:hypothetical protein [Candidatus Magasanikbacteria bacterium]
MTSINQTISSFYKNINNDNNHRYKSWEHCYLYFIKNEKDIDVDIACLHLSFYLASWGMYRGSSPLLWKDYLIHKPVVEKILKNYKYLQKFNYEKKEHINSFFELKKDIKECYEKEIIVVKNKDNKYIASDTLITKILLGTLGCVPAYDKYFKDGLKEEEIKPLSFTKKSINEIIKFYKENKVEFDKAQKSIKNIGKINYPIMKLIDMYFWQIGFEKDKK